MQAVRIHAHGGPEAMVYEKVDLRDPGAGEVRVRIEMAGVNFIDIYQRSGAYPVPLPFTLGTEGAGTVESVGDGVSSVSVGDRVAWAMTPGSYAQAAVLPPEILVPIPADVDTRTAAAVMLQGMTAHYLVKSTYPLGPGKRVLVHAGAGGVGLLLIQLARKLGATVYATVSTAAKAELARGAGADEAMLYTEVDFESEIQRLTDGEGVHAVYDSVGRTTFAKGLNCLRPRGYMILYGQSSGPVEPVNPQILAAKGSLFLTRPSLKEHILTREELLERSSQLFRWISAGELQVRVHGVYPLSAAAETHQLLAGRHTTGKLLLEP